MIIFSVAQNVSMDHDLDSHTRAVDTLLKNGEFDLLMSCLNDHVNVGYMTTQVELGRELARSSNQDFHFEQGHRGKWYLVNTLTDEVVDSFRTIAEVPEEQAKRSGSWLHVDNKFYIAKK